MEYFEITALTGGVFNAVLALMVVRGKVRSKLHLAHLGWGLGLTTWNLAVAMILQQKTPEGGLFWAKILELGVIFLPLSMLHVCLKMTNARPSRWIPFLYAVHAALALTLPGSLYLTGVRLTPFGYWGIAGPAFYVFGVLYVIETSWFMLLLARQRRVVPAIQKTGVSALMVGLFILVICGANDLLPIIGITDYPYIHQHFFPLANLAANLYAIMMAYTVLQHELMDIHITMSKAAAQLVRMGFVFVIALLMLLTAWTAVPHAFTEFSFAISLLVVVASTTVASILFPRLLGMGGDLLERRILGDRFEYDARIHEFIISVHESGDAEQVLKGLEEILINVVRVSGYQVVMMEEVRREFTVLYEYPKGTTPHVPISGLDSPVLNHFRMSGAEYLAAGLPSKNLFSEDEERAARKILTEDGVELCFPFMVSTEPFGLLLLRERAEGRRYTATEINLLTKMAKNLSLAFNHIRLKQQITQAQEAELLGRMSRGMAHDLNNLFTPMRTLMQLMEEGMSVEALRDELLPLASRNMEAIQGYIQSSLFFSEHAHGDFQRGSLNAILEEAAAIMTERCEQKGIKLTIETLTTAMVEMDKSLIKRAVSNVLSNAVDTSSNGSEIIVRVAPLLTAGAEKDWVRVQIIDQGEGISAENLKNIFTPYFSTKNRGDGQRGFGLGLSICRKVVQMHGGSLNVTSQLKKGTTVSIDLPTHPVSVMASVLMPVPEPAVDTGPSRSPEALAPAPLARATPRPAIQGAR